MHRHICSVCIAEHQKSGAGGCVFPDCTAPATAIPAAELPTDQLILAKMNDAATSVSASFVVGFYLNIVGIASSSGQAGGKERGCALVEQQTALTGGFVVASLVSVPVLSTRNDLLVCFFNHHARHTRLSDTVDSRHSKYFVRLSLSAPLHMAVNECV
jgi:hypothetical protein